MTTQSKSVLIPFLIIAGIIFSAALAWKFLGSNETKTTLSSDEVKPLTSVKTTTTSSTKPAKKTPKVVVNSDPMPYIELTEEDKVELKKQAKSNMKFAMRYPTLEKAIDALETFRKNGSNDMAESLIKYINVNFPNDSIPLDLLD